MIAPPATVRTDDQIATYFRNAVDAIGADIPWILQDYPLTTNVVMSANVIRKRLWRICPLLLSSMKTGPDWKK